MENANNKVPPEIPPPKNTKSEEADSTLIALSLSLPMEETNTKSEEISEHIQSPNSESLENDRSFQEIEVPNQYQNIYKDFDEVEHISHEKEPLALDISLNSDSSIISLIFLERIANDYARNILEDIFQTECGESEVEVATNSKEESFDMFQNLDLTLNFDDKNSDNIKHSSELSLDEKNLNATHFGLEPISYESELDKKLKDFEELIKIKDSTITALTCELDSVRELSNTNTVSTLSTTEYKQIQEEWHGKLLEFNSEIMYKNDLIEQLTKSLDQSLKERTQLLIQIDGLKDKILQLQETINNSYQINKKLKKTSTDETETITTEETQLSFLHEVNTYFEPEYVTLQANLDSTHQKTLKNLNLKFNELLEENILKIKRNHEEDKKLLKEDVTKEKEELESEISRLRNLLAEFQCSTSQMMNIKQELEIKHSKEMEELRTYFEKKCAELEKNYSEEIFSQQSKKMSSSSCSDDDMNSDLQLSHIPDQEEDIYQDFQSLNKKDVINLQNELNSIINKISKCDLDSMTEKDFSNLKADIQKSNLVSLLKCYIKSGFQLETVGNKNNLDDIAAQYEEKIREITEKYEGEVENLRCQLENFEKNNINISSTVQEVGSSGEFETQEIIQSYEMRLQEQVSLAKIDIISALENQIQHLVVSEADDEEWPSELLKLRDRFKEKYEKKIKALECELQMESEKLREENLKVVNEVLETPRDGECINNGDTELILKESDGLKRQISSLRNLLNELLKYFTQCEDELNNTLVDELLKQGFDKNLSQIEDELNITQSSPTSSSKTSDSTLNITRVHLTPNFSDLINIIEKSSVEEGDSKDISIELKNELTVCLEKLKHEANAILALTNNITKQPFSANVEDSDNNLEEQITILTRKLTSETQLKEELKSELEENQKYIETLEKERERLEVEIENVIAKENILEVDLANAKNKIGQLLENGRKEIVSEGYGEVGIHLQSLGDTLNMLEELQEKARSVLAQSRTGADPSLLHLIEELCQVVEKVKDESKRDRCDFIQQIEVADKKYKTTQKFLEEQAMEREIERDEAQKKINSLSMQLKEKEKEIVNSKIIALEVNGAFSRIKDSSHTVSQITQLEQQLQEKTAELIASSQLIKDVETERNEAVKKIEVLREIICELELQTESKTSETKKYLEIIDKLQNIIAQQDIVDGNRHGDELNIEELHKHIEQLENELQTLRLQTELAGNEGVTKQIRTQIYEIENQIDKKTKELETLHSTASTNCSSPSEDLSTREIVLPKSPKNMEDCEVPLQQLARLREKLIRHSRAEDAAIKRIKDLEMQVFGLKQELEDSTNEREYLKKQIQEHMVLISDLQIRLDEQRIRADNIEKQTNTSLELKVYDLQKEITSLLEKLQQKEKYINNQTVLLKETQDRLRYLENEVSYSKDDDDLIVDMQKEIDKLRSDNAHLKKKIHNDSQMVPSLVENIISDKNHEMERLRLKLDDTEKLLEAYTSLNLDKKDLQTLASMKHNGTHLEELISILEMSQGDQVRRMDSKNNSESLMSPNLFIRRRKSDETLMDPELSSIIGPNSANSAIQTRNSTELSHKRVHFEDTEIEYLRNEISDLKQLLETKNTVINEYEERLKLLDILETKIENLQKALEETETSLATASGIFETEQKKMEEKEKNLNIQLAEKKLQLEEKLKYVDVLEQDSKRKDEMCMNLTKEKNTLEQRLKTTKQDYLVSMDNAMKAKNCEINSIKQQLFIYNSENEKLQKELSEKNEEINRLIKELDQLTQNLGESQSKNTMLNNNIKEYSSEIAQLRKELDLKNQQIESITTEWNNAKDKLNKKRKMIRELEDQVASQTSSLQSLYEEKEKHQSLILDRDCTIDILHEDADRYLMDIAVLESNLKAMNSEDWSKLKEELQQKEESLRRLSKEKGHLIELLNEKEKIINQMAEDSHKLHLNLVTIKSKIKEPGNILDLANKLRLEQRKSAELVQEIHNLKLQHIHCKQNETMSSVDEIADQLKREVDDSIKIDSKILTAVNDQNLNSFSEAHDIEACKRNLLKEKLNRKQLVQRVHKLHSKITELQKELDKERAGILQTKSDDTQCIQQLRIQLDVALDKEEALKKLLSEKEKENEKLEKEINLLKVKNSNSSKSESTEYKNLPANGTIELNKLQMKYQALQDEKNKLYDTITSLKQMNNELENSLACNNGLLTMELHRKKNLEDKVHYLQIREKELTEVLMQKNLEMDRAISKLAQENAGLTNQKLELIRRLTTNPFEMYSSPNVPDIFLNKIKELNSALIDNKKFMDLIVNISNEKIQLENELKILKGTMNKNSNTQLQVNDLMTRADYLFAKTLKLESTKKALIYQKRYLMQCIMTHKGPTETFPDPKTKQYPRINYNFTPKRRFRSSVFVVISLVRMKYLVRRWNSGVRMAEKINLRHYETCKKPKFNIQSTQFQVGQPVSNQCFFNLPVSSTTNLKPLVSTTKEANGDRIGRFEKQLNQNDVTMEATDLWSGKTPPYKEVMEEEYANLVLQDEATVKAQRLARFVERIENKNKN